MTGGGPDPDAPPAPERTDYAGAVAHYTSPNRRDAVKRHWEEPLLRRLLDDVLTRVDVDPSGPLRVLDVGCGGGGGLSLLDATDHVRARPAPLTYRGLDLDEELLAVAHEQHADDDRASFVAGDMRSGLGAPDVDVYLSTGVPYSHLTAEELTTTLTDVFATAARRSRPTAVVVDVLGRYSIEWPTRWDETRWDYRMSFFEGDAEPPRAQMSVYGGTDLGRLLTHAAAAGGADLDGVRTVDRSVLVGRHTATGDYAPGVPPFRRLVNDLWDARVEVAPDRLRLEVALPDAPDEVHAFYGAFAAAWNDRLEQAAVASDHRSPAAQARLAERLRELEVTRQAGLGVGHSLTAIALVAPAG